MSAFFIQLLSEPSEIPKSFAIWDNGAWPLRATATTSSRNSFGYAFAIADILPSEDGSSQVRCQPNPGQTQVEQVEERR